MSAVATFQRALLDGLSLAPIAWILARALTTAMPLEELRQAVGTRSQNLGSLVTCVECSGAWTSAFFALFISLEWKSPLVFVPAWAGLWAGCLLLDAVLERLRR